MRVKEELPEVVMSTRYSHGGKGIVTFGNKVFIETLTYVDADFFQMFSFELLEGSKEKLFSDQYEVVITPALATKYFGDESPLNKVIEIDNEGANSYTVTGIIAPPLANSSLNYNMILRQENRPYYARNNMRWGNFNTPTFVQLVQRADMQSFDHNLSKLVDKYMAEDISTWDLPEDLSEDIILFAYQYTNLADIHLNTQIP